MSPVTAPQLSSTPVARPALLPAVDRGLASTVRLGEALKNARYIFVLDDEPVQIFLSTATIRKYLEQNRIAGVEIVALHFQSWEHSFEGLAADWAPKMLEAHKMGKCSVAFLDAELQGSANVDNETGSLDLKKSHTGLNLLEELFFRVNANSVAALESICYQIRSGRTGEMTHTVFEHFLDRNVNKDLVVPVREKLQGIETIFPDDFLPSLSLYHPQEPWRVFDSPPLPRL